MNNIKPKITIAMKNLFRYLLTFMTYRHLRLMSLCLALALLLGCEGPFGEQDFTGGRRGGNGVDENNAKHDAKWFTTGSPQLLASGLEGASGSTVGPGGALYVTEGAAGRISRIDPKTGHVTTFASGLPLSIIGIGGAYDIAFLGGKAYVLVTLVGPDVGGTNVVGIYRIDGPTSYTIIADIGAFAMANPPSTGFFVPTGVQYAIETYHGGFLVTDGHHNRMLRVTLDGNISVFKAFENVVPTGIALSGNTVYMTEAGPVPHLPENGKVVSFDAHSTYVKNVASGARLLVDVEFNQGRTLFALSQGEWDGVGEGSPAMPNTGSLVMVNQDGTFTTITDGLDRPTSMEFIKNTAYIVTLGGEVWMIKNVANPPFGNGGKVNW